MKGSIVYLWNTADNAYAPRCSKQCLTSLVCADEPQGGYEDKKVVTNSENQHQGTQNISFYKDFIESEVIRVVKGFIVVTVNFALSEDEIFLGPEVVLGVKRDKLPKYGTTVTLYVISKERETRIAMVVEEIKKAIAEEREREGKRTSI
ncbi:hypothetical protein CEXT_266601 [Caerostris extrusa]|uniref:Uncharacterized protein n=1 Tax=Caerostris extrusa TaxID=172846 RepID=A0AAV4WFX8_CAEEX|nr:hypothetical protein CEXT_266601 [Caerostris extrusa]